MKMKYNGIADAAARFVEKEQLKNRSLWKLTADQFANCPDDGDLGWRGEYWGKLMRGACETYLYTRDEELYEILTESVDQLLFYQDGEGRISTYSKEAEFQGWDMWGRKYVLMGLISYYNICREEEKKRKVIQSAERHLDYIMAHVGKESGKKKITETSDIWQGINSSSILEPVVLLYRIVHEKKYLDFAAYIVDCGGAREFNIFEAAYQNELYPYEYPVVKAYELMSCFEGLLEYSLVVKEEKWQISVKNFIEKLLESERTVVGGLGCKNELLNHGSLMQSGTKYDGIMLETCVSVTWMRLLRRMYYFTGDIKYIDEIERTAFNVLYGSVNFEKAVCGEETRFDEPYYRQVYDRYTADKDGCIPAFDSYSPLSSNIRGRAVGGFKAMEENQAFCGCCIAIGAAGTALVPLLGTEVQDRLVRINLYMPGKLEFLIDSVPVQVEIKTKYPANGEIRMKLSMTQDVWFETELRIPEFSRTGRLTVRTAENNEDAALPEAEKYFSLKRTWKDGDEIVLNLDMNPRILWGMENPEDADSARRMAVLYGPLVLAREKRLEEKEGTIMDCRKEEALNGPLKIENTRKTLSNTLKKKYQCLFDVTIGEETFLMVDYASAGKTWRRDTEMEVWLQTK